MKINIKNFRVFEDTTEFDIRPITILVGPNNSGKSSFTKLLLLLKNGYENLDFEKGEHHLESFKKSLSWDSSNKDISLEFQIPSLVPIKNKYLMGEIIYSSEDIIKKVSLLNGILEFPEKSGGVDIYDFSKEKDEIIVYEKFLNNIRTLTFDFKRFIDFSLSMIEHILHELNFNEFLFDITKTERLYKKLKNIDESDDLFFDDSKQEVYKIVALAVIYNKLKLSIDKDYILFDVFINEKNVTNVYKEQIIQYQNELFEKGEIYHLYGQTETDYTITNIIEDHLTAFYQSIKEKFETEIIKTIKTDFDNINETEIKIVETELANIIFKDKLIPFYDSFSIPEDLVYKTLFESVFESTFFNLKNLKHLHHIPVNRGTQKRIYLSSSYEYQITKEYHKNTIENKIFLDINGEAKKIKKELLKEILNILEIKGELVIENFEKRASALYIKTDKRKINLADYGFGYSQLIPVILELYNINPHFKRIIIIEEPEANLHPALQSKLADIFVLAQKKIENVRFVIETHSEYFIRKLQYLVGNGDYSKDDCIIHYFNSKKNVNKYEPKVKSIEITEDGNLTDNFGSGFFDEATKLQFDLMKINKEQKN